MARSGQLNAGGFGGGYPVKVLAVIDGKTYEKDHSLCVTDMPVGHLKRILISQLPDLEESSGMKYSFSWIADEFVAYSMFEVRQFKVFENVPNEVIDHKVMSTCVMCRKKTDLKVCSGCKHIRVSIITCLHLNGCHCIVSQYTSLTDIHFSTAVKPVNDSIGTGMKTGDEEQSGRTRSLVRN